MPNYTITLIGSGNLGYHLGQALKLAGHQILQVYSRTDRNANELAKLVDAEAITSLSKIKDSADIYIILVPDHQIEIVCKQLREKKGVIIHTAGSISIDVLKKSSNNFGVAYPLQTFSKQSKIRLKETSFFINGNNVQSLEIINSLVKSISDSVIQLSDEKRLTLHIAAVFVNNFCNQLYSIAEEIVQHKNIDFKLLLPLIQETINKLETMKPEQAQTGPAKRNDLITIQTHMDYLTKNNPQYVEVYQLLTKIIQTKSKQ